MVIKDHINLTGDNALRGIVHPEKGFPFISIFYDAELQTIAHEAAKCVPGLSERLRVGYLVRRVFDCVTVHRPSRTSKVILYDLENILGKILLRTLIKDLEKDLVKRR